MSVNGIAALGPTGCSGFAGTGPTGAPGYSGCLGTTGATGVSGFSGIAGSMMQPPPLPSSVVIDEPSFWEKLSAGFTWSSVKQLRMRQIVGPIISVRPVQVIGQDLQQETGLAVRIEHQWDDFFVITETGVFKTSGNTDTRNFTGTQVSLKKVRPVSDEEAQVLRDLVADHVVNGGYSDER